MNVLSWCCMLTFWWRESQLLNKFTSRNTQTGKISYISIGNVEPNTSNAAIPDSQQRKISNLFPHKTINFCPGHFPKPFIKFSCQHANCGVRMLLFHLQLIYFSTGLSVFLVEFQGLLKNWSSIKYTVLIRKVQKKFPSHEKITNSQHLKIGFNPINLTRVFWKNQHTLHKIKRKRN